MSHSVGSWWGLAGGTRNRPRPIPVGEGVPGPVHIPGEGWPCRAPSVLLGAKGISLVHDWAQSGSGNASRLALVALREAGLGAAGSLGRGEPCPPCPAVLQAGSRGDRPVHCTMRFPADGWADYVRHLQSWRD